MDNEKIKAAAIKDQKGDIYSLSPPAHHKQVIQMMRDKGLGTKLMVKGFLTSKDRFVGREEAARIALKAGQAKTLKTENTLHSGDVW